MASSFVAVQKVTKFVKVSCEVPYDIWDEEVKGLSQCDVLWTDQFGEGIVLTI